MRRSPFTDVNAVCLRNNKNVQIDDCRRWTARPIAIYGSNESAANGILDGSNEGADLGKIVAVGFDAGIRQKTAVRAGYFLGSITQDPYNIGYKVVELAYKAVIGEPVANVDTGAKFYTKANIDDPSIKDLVYDW